MNFLRKVKPSSLSSLLRSKPPITHHHHHKVFHNSFFTSRHQNQELQHFPRRGGRGYYRQNWYRDPRVVAVTVVLSGGAAASVYFGNLETVPYTKRTHFVLLSPALERRLGEAQFEEIKNSLRRKILPSVHPDSVRVRLIAGEIVGALQRGLRHSERRWSDLEYSNHPFESPRDAPESEIVDVLGKGGEVEGRGWSREDEVLDDEWVNESRKVKGGAEPATRHLEGLNWEVVVVRDGNVNAFCLPGGKIVVFTGLLDHFRSDSEIATVIGHEVGHAIARHGAEGITKNFWFMLLQLIVLQFFYMPDIVNAMSNLLLRLPFSRRMEIEADYIGLLLMASAGYDPRVAPKVYEKLGKITGDSGLRDYLSTHPSSKKRAQLLSEARVMEEALTIYRETISGRGVAGFL